MSYTPSKKRVSVEGNDEFAYDAVFGANTQLVGLTCMPELGLTTELHKLLQISGSNKLLNNVLSQRLGCRISPDLKHAYITAIQVIGSTFSRN